MNIDLHLPGCTSLKEKRHRLRGIRDRFGKQPNVAVCESDYHNQLQRAQWSVIAVAVDQKGVDQTLPAIEEHISTRIDALIVHIQREHL